MSLVTNSVKFHDRSIAWRVAVLFSQAKMRPPVFDMFYLHKYSHGFSQFPWLIIQFFQKASVATVATLALIGSYVITDDSSMKHIWTSSTSAYANHYVMAS
jgi:hypothetical protein